MIKTHEKLELSPNLMVEVNYNKNVTPCKKFKFIVGDTGKKYIVDRNALYQMMFMFGEDEQQVELVPNTTQEVREVKKVITVKLKKNLKKGDMVSFIHTEYHNIGTKGKNFHHDKSITKKKARKIMETIGISSINK